MKSISSGRVKLNQTVILLPLLTNGHKAVDNDLNGNAKATAVKSGDAFGEFISNGKIEFDVKFLFDLQQEFLNGKFGHSLKLVDAAPTIELRVGDVLGAFL